MRDYTAAEIDELRIAVANRVLWGRYTGAVGWSAKEADPVVVELQVQTHMMAGHTAQSLVDEERAAHAAGTVIA